MKLSFFRSWRFVMPVVALGISMFSAKTIFAASFTDVPSTNPYYAAVESLKNLGAISGYSDGTYRPNNSVNRAEALKLILSTAQIEVDPGYYQTGFPDVKISDWFSGYVFNAQNLNIIKGNADGTFAPNRQVNKAEFLKMTEQAFKVDLSNYQTSQTAISADIQVSNDWFFPYMDYAQSVGIIAPTIDKKLQPQQFLTRGECAEILYNMYIIKNGGATQQLLSTAEAQLIDAIVSINQNDSQDALAQAQEAVFYTNNALKQSPDSNVTQGASLIAQGFQNLFEAYNAAKQNDTAQLTSLVTAAKSDADQAVAKDSSLQYLSQNLKTLADSLPH